MSSRTCVGLWSREILLAAVGIWTADCPVRSPVAVVTEPWRSVLAVWRHLKYCSEFGVILIPSFITGNSHHVEHKNGTSPTTLAQYSVCCVHFLGPVHVQSSPVQSSPCPRRNACNFGYSLKSLYKFPQWNDTFFSFWSERELCTRILLFCAISWSFLLRAVTLCCHGQRHK